MTSLSWCSKELPSAELLEPGLDDGATLLERDPGAPEHRRDLPVGAFDLGALLFLGKV